MPDTSPSPLDNLRIASPCHASWDAMSGDDKARFCKTCQKNVFNLSMMTREQAETLIRAREGDLCVRYAQREDGTILTQDCPVGLERVRQQALRPWRTFAAGVAGIVAALCGLFNLAPRLSAQPPLDLTSKVTPCGPGGLKGPTPATRMGDVALSCTPKNHEAIVAPPSPVTAPPTLMGRPAMPGQGGLQTSPAPPRPAVKMGEPEAIKNTQFLTVLGSPAVSPTSSGKPSSGKTAGPAKNRNFKSQKNTKSERAAR